MVTLSMLSKAIGKLAACLGRGLALGGGLVLIVVSAAQAQDVAVTWQGANKLTISVKNTGPKTLDEITAGPSDPNGNAFTSLKLPPGPCGDAGSQHAWACLVKVAPGATVTGPATVQHNLVQDSVQRNLVQRAGFKVKICTTDDFFATNVTCQDVTAKPPVTPHLKVVKVALVVPRGGHLEDGVPENPFSTGPRARAVEEFGTVFYVIGVRNDGTQTASDISVSDLLPPGCVSLGGFSRPSMGLVVSEDKDIPPGGLLRFVAGCAGVTDDLDNSVQVRQGGKTIGVASAQHITVGRLYSAPIKHVDSHEVDGETSRVQIASAPAFFPVTGVQVAIRRLGVHGCRWLSAKGSFVKRPADKGSCDVQVWLTAHGMHHWSLRFAHKLTPGRYLIEARTINHLGAVDDRFSTRAHNLRTLTVR